MSERKKETVRAMKERERAGERERYARYKGGDTGVLVFCAGGSGLSSRLLDMQAKSSGWLAFSCSCHK